jgi:hypothetical protein
MRLGTEGALECCIYTETPQVAIKLVYPEYKTTYIVICSSPVTEDVPPRRDRSIHGVPPQ